ncbi:MAG: glycoside hydrolase family 15 protein [Steroidobacter sp.]
MAGRIEDYALIGDCESAALVSSEGSIDWLCWPRFDSDACFAALLGDASHGRWLLAPRDSNIRSSRRYRDDTLILETRFETDSGAVLVIDLMPPRGHSSDLVRLVVCERGEVAMRTELVLRFGYGASVPWVTRVEEGVWRAVAGPDMTILRTSAPMHGENLKSVADFVVRAGECVSFVLTYQPSHLDTPPRLDVDEALRATEAFWRDWVAKGRTTARWSPAVTRSLITLRALIYRPTGGIIAAPTTSLPEHIGGERNWDYRYCWLRDATLTLLALMNAGYYEEAKAWRNWLMRAIAGSPNQMQIMYGVAGERRLSEWEAPWLPGYENSRPVRIGNEAYAQLQLDVFGEVMDALHQARDGGLAPTEPGWAMQRELLAHLSTAWEQPDYGIWEVRGPPRHFTYSKIMAWVAFDRAIKDAERYNLSGPTEVWRATRERIHRQVCERGYDAARNCFVQSYGSTQLDASLLLICELGFLPATDPRMLGTIQAIETHLLRDGLLLRYDTSAADDGLPPGEGVFLACSFWLADAYCMCGRMQEAEALFERLVALSNDVGLLAEEFDPTAGRQVGNFPQGFSHLSLINTAFNLREASKPVEQRSDAEVPSPGRAAVQ